MGALLKFAATELANKSLGEDNANLNIPEKSLDGQVGTAAPDSVAPDRVVTSNPMGMKPLTMSSANNVGVNDYSNQGKAGTTPGYTDLWAQQSVSTKFPTYNPETNSLAKSSAALLPAASLMLGGGTLAYGGKKIYDHIEATKEDAKAKALSRVPRALLAALATGALGYKANDYVNDYVDKGDSAQSSLYGMRSRFNANKFSAATDNMIEKVAAISAPLATALGLGTAGGTMLALPAIKKIIDTEADKRVDEATKYWTPGAAIAGLGLGYLGGDAHRMYKAKGKIDDRKKYIDAYRAMQGMS